MGCLQRLIRSVLAPAKRIEVSHRIQTRALTSSAVHVSGLARMERHKRRQQAPHRSQAIPELYWFLTLLLILTLFCLSSMLRPSRRLALGLLLIALSLVLPLGLARLRQKTARHKGEDKLRAIELHKRFYGRDRGRADLLCRVYTVYTAVIHWLLH